ncbi:MAG TPA: S-adenosylmethionine:tRNA ribosyltransferase-isomerase [Acidimicrobiales bacterium]|nr:S-adenosylmethionine:tRNA ribosyltransferase-isomerase [Acidimicrobiales bacterium]
MTTTIESPVTRRLHFELPTQLEASTPPEARGITRDAVRLMVAYKSDNRLVHANFNELPRFLDAGDLVVVNTSGTLAAAVDATAPDGTALAVHLSTQLPAGLWVVELREDGHPFRGAQAGWTLRLPASGEVELLAPYGESNGRLWVAAVRLLDPLLTYLAVHGRPITYGYVHGSWPITMYQNVYANEPGSAEMPSAGRPFTPEIITRLVAKGVGVAPLVLHTGVSSLESHEAPYAEYFRVPTHSAHLVNDTHRQGGRVIAIGTTVVRSLETVADERGRVHPGEGWTETVITPERGVHAVDGMLTGWHEPEASHLDMLEAIAGRELVEVSYDAALAEQYLWHEFGDVHLILP